MKPVFVYDGIMDSSSIKIYGDLDMYGLTMHDELNYYVSASIHKYCN